MAATTQYIRTKSNIANDNADRCSASEHALVNGRKAMSNLGGMGMLICHLKEKVHKLNFDKDNVVPVKGDFRDLLALNWVEELLRFLALKSSARDLSSSACELAPSALIEEAWRSLLLMPKLYDALCTQMGCTQVIDHDPSESRVTVYNEDRLLDRYATTVALYKTEFGQDPPTLFWIAPKVIPHSLSQHIYVMKKAIRYGMHQKLNEMMESFHNDNSAGGENEESCCSQQDEIHEVKKF